jgi:hypothetical protein
MAWHGRAWQGRAGQGKARQGKASHWVECSHSPQTPQLIIGRVINDGLCRLVLQTHVSRMVTDRFPPHPRLGRAAA